MARQVQIRPEPADHYLCHPNIIPDSTFCRMLNDHFAGASPGIPESRECGDSS